MSFSSDVKEELARHTSAWRHCQLAELAAILCFAGRITTGEGALSLRIESENPALTLKYFTLLQKTFKINAETEKLGQEQLLKVLKAVKMWNASEGCFLNASSVDRQLLQQTCCRRAYIRGAYLASGSMSDPGKSYHFEIVAASLSQAQQLQEMMNTFDVEAKIVARKKNQVVYLKEGAHIVEILNVMEAHIALMKLENVRIVKEMRNTVNRKVNCETANIGKTVGAAVKQIEDIELIQQKAGLNSLPDNLKDLALLRMQYPDAPLKELGTYLDPPVGKSGVNHRFRKLAEIAEELAGK